jgi:Sodium/calcium exchanger protein
MGMTSWYPPVEQSMHTAGLARPILRAAGVQAAAAVGPPGDRGPAVAGGAAARLAGARAVLGQARDVGGRPILTSALASVATLVAGVLLERSGNQLADDWGMNGVVFGATFLAAATALPEISTGVTEVRLARYTLVFGDMLGGNAFQLTRS